jgi:hypothetical protein
VSVLEKFQVTYVLATHVMRHFGQVVGVSGFMICLSESEAIEISPSRGLFCSCKVYIDTSVSFSPYCFFFSYLM